MAASYEALGGCVPRYEAPRATLGFATAPAPSAATSAQSTAVGAPRIVIT